MWKQPVAVGDDGRRANPDPDDGPLLHMLKDYLRGIQEDYRKTLEQHRLEIRQMLYAATPNLAMVMDSGSPASNGASLHLDLGGPQLGRRWIVRQLKACNAFSVGDSAPGSVNWYVGQAPNALGRSNPVNWVATASAMPNIQTYTSEIIYIQPNDHLYATISGSGTLAATPYLAAALIMDYDANYATGPAVRVV